MISSYRQPHNGFLQRIHGMRRCRSCPGELGRRVPPTNLEGASLSLSPLYSGERGWGEGAVSASRTPHPRPLSPEYRGEGRQALPKIERHTLGRRRTLAVSSHCCIIRGTSCPDRE